MATLPYSPQVVAELLLKVSQDFGCRFDEVQADIVQAPAFRVELDPVPTERNRLDLRDAGVLPSRRVDYAPVPVLKQTVVEARVTVGLRNALYQATIEADYEKPTQWVGPTFVGHAR